MVILDISDTKFIDKEFEDCLIELNKTVDQNIDSSTDDTIRTGCLYLKGILYFIFYNNVLTEDKKLKENFFGVMEHTIQHDIESNLKLINEKITRDSFTEIKSFEELCSLYYSLKFILLAKQFYLQWFVHLTMENCETDGDDEIMLDLESNKLQNQGILWCALSNQQKISILKIVLKEFNRQCNYCYSDEPHPYALEIKDL